MFDSIGPIGPEHLKKTDAAWSAPEQVALRDVCEWLQSAKDAIDRFPDACDGDFRRASAMLEVMLMFLGGNQMPDPSECREVAAKINRRFEGDEWKNAQGG